MINPFKEVNWNPVSNELRTFAKSLILGFPIIALLMLLAHKIAFGTWNIEFPRKLAGTGIAFGLIFIFFPVVARPFYFAWYALSCAIGLIISNVSLVVLYYTFFTGTGILRRIIGKSPVNKDLNPIACTYWVDAEETPSPKRYYNQF